MTRPCTFIFYGIAATVIFLLLLTPFHIFSKPSTISRKFNGHLVNQQPQSQRPTPSLSSAVSETTSWHPIDDLILAGSKEAQRLENVKTLDVHSAAAEYRKRRGRHPPPNFDEWVAFASKNDAIITEEFFDQIYHDLEPFWGLNPSEIRIPEDWAVTLNIRDGKMTVRKHPKSHVSGEWDDLWLDMFRQIEEFLPDVDMAINDLDEPRVSVPWETMSRYTKKASKTKMSFAALSAGISSLVSTYRSLPPPPGGQDLLDKLDGVGPRWENPTEFWQVIREACPPTSPARHADLDADMSLPPQFPQDFPLGSHHGFVANWTFSKSVCDHAHLRNQIGTFVHPRYNSINTTLFPLFSGCKIQGLNNEILLPAAKYWTTGKRFAFKSESVTWEQKLDQIIWRGQASGGAHNKTNWKRFHRQRFMAMLNGTEVTIEERSHALSNPPLPLEPPHNIPLPNVTLWDLGALQTQPTTLGAWVGPYADAGFIHFHCNPWMRTVIFGNRRCVYTDPFYSAKSEIPLESQWNYKFLPDVDGNSYSGRFRAFMLSGSLPIKATIWNEWHDSRLVPWRHFVPMDNTYVDWWGILEYLVGFKGHGVQERKGHDAQAKAIAEQGRDWAAKVLRQEDMLVYVYRLMLEYARVCSEERDRMAYVGDLLAA